MYKFQNFNALSFITNVPVCVKHLVRKFYCTNKHTTTYLGAKLIVDIHSKVASHSC